MEKLAKSLRSTYGRADAIRYVEEVLSSGAPSYGLFQDDHSSVSVSADDLRQCIKILNQKNAL